MVWFCNWFYLAYDSTQVEKEEKILSPTRKLYGVPHPTEERGRRKEKRRGEAYAHLVIHTHPRSGREPQNCPGVPAGLVQKNYWVLWPLRWQPTGGL